MLPKMKIKRPISSPGNGQEAFTIVEVMVAFAVAALMIAGMVQGYSLASRRTEFATYNLAAESMALKQMELAMTASLRPDSGVDQLLSSNFTNNYDYLCMPVSETNLVSCTNYTTITTISANPTLKMIQVDTVWSFLSQAVTGTKQTFTTTVATIHAPNIGQ